ncbi:hypothetical protein C0995_008397 [Termitomyces sp. Mi166|nr:hypothetical protein C0995_008397 [Termitomyces sp. Mi166\
MNRATSDEYIATSERNFCSKCSSMLWLYDETWPELIHPFASAIDSPDLKVPEKLVRLFSLGTPSDIHSL